MTPISSSTQCSQITPGQNNPPAGVSTESCFLWLHRKNTAFSMNIRGMVNHEYNRLLTEKALVQNLIPGGEDLEQLGMDRQTPIVRPDLYFAACDKVISIHTGVPFEGLNLSTAAFFDLLHEENKKNSANVRGLINQKYNQLLSEAGINDGKIPGSNPEELGMDASTPLRADLYAKAYGQIIVQFEAPQPKPSEPEPTWHNSLCLPFENPDIFRYTAQFMGYGGIFLCAQVCKLWNSHSNNLPWQQFFTNEGIPLVEEEEGKESNYKEEFRVLCPMTINLRMIEGVFGRVVCEILFIRRDIFNKCYEEDPFELTNPSSPEKEKLLMMHTFKFVVIPASIERTSCAEFPYTVDSNGDLQPVEPGKATGQTFLQPVEPGKATGQTLKIPLGIRNLKILCEHPLAGKENMPVFTSFLPEILDKCNTHLDKARLCFMRNCVAEESRNKSYSEQKALVERLGFGVPSLMDRVFFDAVCILTSDTCSDGQNPYPYPRSFARTSDSVVLGGSNYQLVVGGFAPRAGAVVFGNDYADDCIGVAPGVPAEVLRTLELDTLGLGKGH